MSIKYKTIARKNLLKLNERHRTQKHAQNLEVCEERMLPLHTSTASTVMEKQQFCTLTVPAHAWAPCNDVQKNRINQIQLIYLKCE